jgi:hypothetical protein
MEIESTPGCFRCGKETGGLSAEALAELAAHIPIAESLRAEAGVYEKRLALCASCDALREDILCSYCGCFIVFRARPAKSVCPHPAGDKWL